jgi:hypothetical protein
MCELEVRLVKVTARGMNKVEGEGEITNFQLDLENFQFSILY